MDLFSLSFIMERIGNYDFVPDIFPKRLFFHQSSNLKRKIYSEMKWFRLNSLLQIQVLNFTRIVVIGYWHSMLNKCYVIYNDEMNSTWNEKITFVLDFGGTIFHNVFLRRDSVLILAKMRILLSIGSKLVTSISNL